LPILSALAYWWYAYKPKELLEIYLKLNRKALNFFSLDLLVRTLFQPWKRDEIDMSNLSLQDRLRVLLMNLVSRLVGATVRGGTILAGLLILAGLFVVFVAGMLVFILLPFISIYLIISSLLRI